MVTTGFATSWLLPPETLLLGSDAVHVWCASLNLGPSRIQALERTLSTDERERASRFHFHRDRECFIASRGILRFILGRYLDREPADLRFFYNAYGKPALTEEMTDGLRFNLSHSAGLALYAVAQNREVGIDLEWIRPSLAREQIAERVFSAAEVAALRSLPDQLQAEGFFTYWTLKEAFTKAKGEGLTLPLDGFEVSPSSEGQVAGLTLYGHPQEARCWSLLKLLPAPGYLAALAIEGSNWCLQCWQWREEHPMPDWKLETGAAEYGQPGSARDRRNRRAGDRTEAKPDIESDATTGELARREESSRS